MNSPLVYVVILNYKNYEDTIECVCSVEKIHYSNYQIIIVDNNSNNGSEEILRDRFPTHIFIQSGENRGYSAGNNIGIKMALDSGADYIMILNNDTIVEEDFLDKLVEYAESNPDVGLLSPKIVNQSGELDLTCARRRPTISDYFWRLGPGKWLSPNNKWLRAHFYMDEYDFQDIKAVDIISGSCMLFKSELLHEIGLLDEKTFLFLEEFIVHEKIRKTKYKTVIVPSSWILHKGHASIKKMNYEIQLVSYKSLLYYLLNYRTYGKTSTIFAISSVSIKSGVAMIGMLIKAVFTSLRNNGCRQ